MKYQAAFLRSPNGDGTELKMKKTITFLLILALSATALCSCKGPGGDENVAIFYYTYADTYISTVRSAMDKSLRRAGIAFQSYDSAGDQANQTNQIDTAISMGATMLVVNLVTTGSRDAAETIVEKARAADIPLIFFNRSVDKDIVESYSKCVFVGTDYEMAGHMQGELIGNYLVENYDNVDLNGDGKISYILFKGENGNAEAEARTRYSVIDANRILEAEGKSPLVFYDPRNTNGYLVDQGGLWSSESATNYMNTALSAYSEAGGNMIEMVIANNDEMALGAISALESAGYNTRGGKTIPVFGVDATSAAISAIDSGKMAGTVKQDGEAMAETIAKIVSNMTTENTEFFEGIDEEMIVGSARVNIPYALYTKE